MDASQQANGRPSKILVIDLGGTRVKALATGQTEKRDAPSGSSMTPVRLVETARELARDWEYEAVSLGYPGQVGPEGPRADNRALAPGWVGFDFAAAFGAPVKVINDAAMQALGSYAGGRMLFLGLGTGVGSALVTGRSIFPLELGCLRFTRRRTLHDCLGREGLRRLGLRRWREALAQTVAFLKPAFAADYVMIGGGNAKKVGEPPPWSRLGSNLCAFRGGYRLWGLELTPTMTPDGRQEEPPPADREWRLV
ncbi:MAG TPA: ROK family protein [Gemmataceae bacterium]|nr:ROK family protein [Gemmataceae bacterium]